MIMKFKIRSDRQIVLGSFILLIIASLSLAGFADSVKAEKISIEKADLIGRVEDFFLHNFRDITSRKSLEWGQPETDEMGNNSIRYMYVAQILNKEWKIMNQFFTFNKDGRFIDVREVSGYTKDKQVSKAGTSSTEEGKKVLRAVALRAVDALLLEGDLDKGFQYFAEDAKQKNEGPGSAIEAIKKENLPLPEEFVTLKEIVFFTEKDIDRMSVNHPNDMWERVREPVKGGLGCLATLEVKTAPNETISALFVFVLQERAGQYKIVYTDDN